MERRWTRLAVFLCATTLGSANTARGGCTGRPDGTTCDAGTDLPYTSMCVDNECVPCTVDGSASPAFVDNGNGTITDRKTCLVWEKKDNAGGIHDLNHTYDWAHATSAFLPLLNNPSSPFAGHTDWRLPTAGGLPGALTGQPAEVESIQAGCPSDGGGCIAAAFDTNCGPYFGTDPPVTTSNPGCTVDGAGGTEECSCTPFSHYWSASYINAGTGNAWLMCYIYPAPENGLSHPSTTGPYLARAVRGGATEAPEPSSSGASTLALGTLGALTRRRGSRIGWRIGDALRAP